MGDNEVIDDLLMKLKFAAREQKRAVRVRLAALKGDDGIRIPSRGPIQFNGSRCIRWHFWQMAQAKQDAITRQIRTIASMRTVVAAVLEAKGLSGPANQGQQRITRPAHVPALPCPPKCGHSEDEHIAFDWGVYDGEHGIERGFAESLRFGRLLWTVYRLGLSLGKRNRAWAAAKKALIGKVGA